jgi:hypothetical protein
MAGREPSEVFQERIGRLKVSELMDRYPESKPVLFNHLGASCFECPAAMEETVSLALRVHRSLEDEFYQDLARVFSSTPAIHEIGFRNPSNEEENRNG